MTEVAEKPDLIEGNEDGEGLAKRPQYRHHVEQLRDLLIAARTNSCNEPERLEFHFSVRKYTERQKPKEAAQRYLVVKVPFKHNVGHLGTDIVFAGTHLHNETAKGRWQSVLIAYWDGFARSIRSHGINFFAGDFNMSFSDVCNQLRSRGIEVDLVAWRPFHITGRVSGSQCLGFDSCGIFYVGGTAAITLQYSLEDVEMLVSDDDGTACLLQYADNCCPG